jgi:hypothetical protein
VEKFQEDPFRVPCSFPWIFPPGCRFSGRVDAFSSERMNDFIRTTRSTLTDVDPQGAFIRDVSLWGERPPALVHAGGLARSSLPVDADALCVQRVQVIADGCRPPYRWN